MFLFMFDSGSRDDFVLVQAEMQRQGINYYVPRRGTDIIFIWRESTPPQFIAERTGSANECRMIGQCPSLPEVGQSEDDFEDRQALGLISKV